MDDLAWDKGVCGLLREATARHRHASSSGCGELQSSNVIFASLVDDGYSRTHVSSLELPGPRVQAHCIHGLPFQAPRRRREVLDRALLALHNVSPKEGFSGQIGVCGPRHSATGETLDLKLAGLGKRYAESYKQCPLSLKFSIKSINWVRS